MAYITVSVGGAQNDSRFGLSQFPIKSFLEKQGEAFEAKSVLDKLFRMDNAESAIERYTGETAMDNFVPVGEGGTYPKTGFMEGYSKDLAAMTWKSGFDITQEAVEDNKIRDMKKAANKFITSYDRTRELFGRQAYVGGMIGTSFKVGGKTFDCSGADGKALFSTSHPQKVKGGTQSNLYTDIFDSEALDKISTNMQNIKGDNGELLNIVPDTIWIPNDATLKRKVFEVIGADKDPDTDKNGFYYQFGLWNVIIDPYLTQVVQESSLTKMPWFIMDRSFCDNNDGAVWADRIPLSVTSNIDSNNDNNNWRGRARFTAGFVDWRFIAGSNSTETVT